MATFNGTVARNNLEGGFFELNADDGNTYRLDGAKGLTDGQQVVVHGEVKSGGFGIHMSGPAIAVFKVEPA